MYVCMHVCMYRDRQTGIWCLYTANCGLLLKVTSYTTIKKKKQKKKKENKKKKKKKKTKAFRHLCFVKKLKFKTKHFALLVFSGLVVSLFASCAADPDFDWDFPG